MAITADTLKPNQFNKAISGVSDSFAFTKSDTNFFAHTPTGGSEKQIISKGISVAAAGVYAFVMASGNTVAIYLAAGIIHPIHAKQHLSAGTTGTGILIVHI